MKLCESADFRDAILAAKEHFANFGLTEAFIEKDYYVTEALRIVATQWPTQVIFKGGTSLSKGWKLIERFSEDIDLFLNKDAFTPRLGESLAERELKAIETAVSQHPRLTLIPSQSQSKRGIYRHSYFSYPQEISGVATISDRLFLEVGTRSGTYPVETVSLSSYLAEFLGEIGNSLNAEDESSFPMVLLHFRRTFVEKLFAIHAKVRQYQREEVSLGSATRHYYDLFSLAQTPEVQQMLGSGEYSDIKQDCDRLSQKAFKQEYDPPENLVFSNSIALFPIGELRQAIAKEYQQQCQNLCYGNYPRWEEIEVCFSELRKQL